MTHCSGTMTRSQAVTLCEIRHRAWMLGEDKMKEWKCVCVCWGGGLRATHVAPGARGRVGLAGSTR